MTPQDIINKAAQAIIDQGFHMVSILATTHDNQTVRVLMVIPRKGGERMAKAKPKKKSKKMPMKKMC